MLNILWKLSNRKSEKKFGFYMPRGLLYYSPYHEVWRFCHPVIKSTAVTFYLFRTFINPQSQQILFILTLNRSTAVSIIVQNVSCNGAVALCRVNVELRYFRTILKSWSVEREIKPMVPLTWFAFLATLDKFSLQRYIGRSRMFLQDPFVHR